MSESNKNHRRIGALAHTPGAITQAEIKTRLRRPSEHRNTLAFALTRLCRRGFIKRSEDGHALTPRCKDSYRVWVSSQ